MAKSYQGESASFRAEADRARAAAVRAGDASKVRLMDAVRESLAQDRTRASEWRPGARRK